MKLLLSFRFFQCTGEWWRYHCGEHNGRSFSRPGLPETFGRFHRCQDCLWNRYDEIRIPLLLWFSYTYHIIFSKICQFVINFSGSRWVCLWCLGPVFTCCCHDSFLTLSSELWSEKTLAILLWRNMKLSLALNTAFCKMWHLVSHFSPQLTTVVINVGMSASSSQKNLQKTKSCGGQLCAKGLHHLKRNCGPDFNSSHA